MLREIDFPLPRAVIEQALEKKYDKGFAPLIEQAIKRIIEGPPGHRVALMQAGLPFTLKTEEMFRYPCVIQSEQFRQLESFCERKALNMVVLIAGAMAVELGTSNVAPNQPEGCPTAVNRGICPPASASTDGTGPGGSRV